MVEPDYTGEYEEAKRYADIIGHKYANKIYQPSLWEDFSQEYLAAYFNPDIIKNAIRDDGSIISNFAGFIATRKLVTHIRKYYLNSKYNTGVRLLYIGDELVNRRLYIGDELVNRRLYPSLIIDDIIVNEAIDHITYLISALKGKRKLVMQLLYIRGLTQKEASIELGVTESAISLTKKSALKRIKRMAVEN